MVASMWDSMNKQGGGTHDDPKKWGLPGWRVERDFRNQVLLGNWYEERRRFTRTNYKHTTTHSSDYQGYPDFVADKYPRREHAIAREGRPEQLLTRHHGDAYDNVKITNYDEHYNRRERVGRNKLPPLRRYNTHKMGWDPEVSQHPITGMPTNWGLREAKKREWDANQNIWKEHICGESLNRITFKKPERKDYPDRFSITQRSISSQLRPNIQINKNLKLRGQYLNVAPERPPNIQPPAKNYPIIAKQA